MYTTAQILTDSPERSCASRSLPEQLADEREGSAEHTTATFGAERAATASSGGSPAPIDIQQLERRLRFRHDAVRNVLKLFPDECLRSLVELKRSIAAGELCGAAEIAHRIKGGAGTISAGPLYLAAAGVEDACRNTRIELILVRLADLCRETSRTVEYVTAFLEGPRAAYAK